MKLVVLFFILIVFLQAEPIYKPDKVESRDLERLLKLETELYELSNKQHVDDEDFIEIFNFIWAHRSIRIIPLLERINVDVIAFGGGRNVQGAFYSPNNDYNLNPYAYVGLQAQLKILDPKEAREKQETILKQRSDILRILKDYQQARSNLEHSKSKIEILRLKENRLKIRVYNAVANFDERIENLEQLHLETKTNDLLKIDVETLEARILDLVEDNFRNELKLRLREQL